MEPLERSNLVDQAETALLAGIKAGHWKGTLPGVRMLCLVLKISSPTLKLATNRLLKRGILVSQGPRRRFEIAPIHLVNPTNRNKGGSPEKHHRRILCLTDNALPQMSHHRLQTLSQLRIECGNWDIRHHVVSSVAASGYHQQWDRLVNIEKPDAMIIFGGRDAISRWSHERGVPTVFIGGDPGTFPLPIIGMSLNGLVANSLATLIQHGHRDVCMPMFDLIPGLENAQRSVFSSTLEQADIPFDPAWNTPTANQRDPDVVINTMIRIARVRMPTAVIGMSWEETLAILSFLQQQRLNVPHDVSLISLGTSNSGNWFRPRITHFEYAIPRIARSLKRWIDHDFPPPGTRLIIPAHMVRGESIARPRV